jgi:hypothetical protein
MLKIPTFFFSHQPAGTIFFGCACGTGTGEYGAARDSTAPSCVQCEDRRIGELASPRLASPGSYYWSSRALPALPWPARSRAARIGQSRRSDKAR